MEIHHFALCPMKNVRFLSILNSDTVVFSNSFDRCSGIPLFLGKDVLDGICIQGKNHARIHARFAKDGVAVKLNLCEFGIEGINNSKSLYFYSVQGLFQAVFEYHDFEVQRECLIKVRDLWLKHHTDPLLPESMKIKHVATSNDNIVNIATTVADMDSGDRPSGKMTRCQKCGSHFETSSDCMQPSISNQTEARTESVASENSNQHMTSARGSPSKEVTSIHSSSQFGIEVASSICSKNILSTTYNKKKCNHFPCDVSTQTLNENIYPGSVQTKGSKCKMKTFKQNDDAMDGSTLLEHVDVMIRNIKLIQNKEKSHSQTMTKLANTLVLLNFIKGEIYADHFNPQNSFPLQLLEKYLSAVQGGSLKQFSNTFGIPCKREAALSIVSDWLGKQFHRMESAISVKVDQFKIDHIACIDNLPPSDQIIDMLFPACMRQLISNWIGQENIGVPCLAASDHDYGPPQKRAKGHATQEATLYPVIQLLLEFANNALVSGVAHVVYSRLRHSLL